MAPRQTGAEAEADSPVLTVAAGGVDAAEEARRLALDMLRRVHATEAEWMEVLGKVGECIDRCTFRYAATPLASCVETMLHFFYMTKFRSGMSARRIPAIVEGWTVLEESMVANILNMVPDGPDHDAVSFMMAEVIFEAVDWGGQDPQFVSDMLSRGRHPGLFAVMFHAMRNWAEVQSPPRLVSDLLNEYSWRSFTWRCNDDHAEVAFAALLKYGGVLPSEAALHINRFLLADGVCDPMSR